jgi:hypothetical protein
MTWQPGLYQGNIPDSAASGVPKFACCKSCTSRTTWLGGIRSQTGSNQTGVEVQESLLIDAQGNSVPARLLGDILRPKLDLC